MNPEQRLLIIKEYMPVELFVFLIRTFRRLLRPERMNVIDRNRTLFDFRLFLFRLCLNRLLCAVLIFLFFCLCRNSDPLNDLVILTQIRFVNCLVLRLGICLRQEDFVWHKCTVLFQNAAHAVLVGILQAILVQVQGYHRADFFPAAASHGILCAAVTLPVNRLCAVLERKRVNIDLICNHERRVESETKMPDDLILICLILILLQELRCTGKCDVCDVLLYFLSGHAKSVVNKCQRLRLIIHDHVNRRFVIIRQMLLANRIQLSALRNRVTRIRNHLTYENVLIRIHPLFNNRKYIFTVN